MRTCGEVLKRSFDSFGKVPRSINRNPLNLLGHEDDELERVAVGLDQHLEALDQTALLVVVVLEVLKVLGDLLARLKRRDAH